ncbi:hypothetical protein DB771_04290 [Burkholderia sp. AU29985]|nr:hypothetical protein XM57_04325 [Burkholderia cepacia]AYZ96985.1 hypothetical protein EGY28_18040 [Burkholderia dolosa]ETP66722.1 hypothetical protein BDSB_00785 [Burkholderia dolosa PC543]PRE43122.1 hypothetical protein C6P87_25455 [Burkholderia sp. AU12872]PUA78058.1 hypothetical protein DB771_04290 [Burkholderia sp. AU29985]
MHRRPINGIDADAIGAASTASAPRRFDENWPDGRLSRPPITFQNLSDESLVTCDTRRSTDFRACISTIH